MTVGSEWSEQPVITPIVIIAGGVTGEGLFVYSGTPAAGNLIVSIAAAAGTDSFGNNYTQGIMEQSPGAALVNINNGAVAFGSVPSRAPLATSPDAIALTLQSGISALGHTVSMMQFLQNVTTVPTAPQQILTDGLVAWDPSNLHVTAEAWHSPALATGWTGSIRYKLAVDLNRVFLECNATFTDNGTTHLASGTAMLNAALPTAYRPASTTPELAAGFAGTGATITASRVPCVHVGTGGQVFADFVTTTAGTQTAIFQGEFSYPLD